MEARERHRKMRDILEVAHEMPADKRKAYVREQCGSDPDLFQEIEDLMAENISGFLDTSPAEELLKAAVASADPLFGDPPPDLIPGFRILRKLGAGGMGVAFAAEQLEPKRTVALKMIRPDRVGKQWLERFRHEWNALGRLQHPNIAKVYEASIVRTAAGQTVPYIAMEYIDGMPLTTYVVERGLSVRERVEMMAAICDAAQHAHHQGIIHRDIKPANILVDKSGRPFMLDFGVALILNSETRLTLSGMESGPLIGTLEYMSPEQAGGDGVDVDTRLDVYSLGMVFYEMLTYQRAYDLSEKNLLEALSIIQHTVPRKPGLIEKRLKGDLETIVMKALEKERSQRYQGAGDLRDDLGRFLKDQPIQARRPSVAYALRKFAKRHRGATIGAAAALMFLIGGLIATSISLRQVSEEKAVAIRERDNARAANDFLQDAILTVAPDSYGPAAPIGSLLNGAMKRVATGALAATPTVDADISDALGVTFTKIGEYAAAKAMLSRSLDLLARENPRRPRQLGDSTKWLANVARQTAQFDEANRLFQKAVDYYQEAGEEKSIITTKLDWAWLKMERGDVAGAMPMFKQEVEDATRVFGLENIETVKAIEGLGGMYIEMHDPKAAEAEFARAIELMKKIANQEETAEGARLLVNMAMAYKDQKEYDKAEALLREGLAIQQQVFGQEPNTNVANTLGLLCLVLQGTHKLAEAHDVGLQALAMNRAAFGETSAQVAQMTMRLAYVDEETGDVAAAEAGVNRALAMYEKTLGPANPATFDCMRNAAEFYWRQKNPQKASDLLEELNRREKQRVGEDYPPRIETLDMLATGRADLGDKEGALAAETEALGLERRIHGSTRLAASIGVMRARLLAQLQRPAEAENALLAAWDDITDAHMAAGEASGVARELADFYNAAGKADAAKLWEARAAATRP